MITKDDEREWIRKRTKELMEEFPDLLPGEASVRAMNEWDEWMRWHPQRKR